MNNSPYFETRVIIRLRGCNLDVLARSVAGLIWDHERRAVNGLLRPPVALDRVAHAVLALLAFLDHATDQHIRQDAGGREA
jgi:hypothetical protein